MQSVISFLLSGTGRRLIVFAVGVLAVALNRKLGLELDTTEQGALVALIIAYLSGSNYKEAQLARAAAAGAKSASAVTTEAEAVRVLRGPEHP